MSLFIKAALVSLAGIIMIVGQSAKAAPSKCEFEGTQPKTCRISHKAHSGGWTKEVLTEPNGTTRIISREVRGNNVQINLFAPGQNQGSFHQGTYTESGDMITILVDGGIFSYTK